jgi:hypothetical protein
VAWYIGSLHSEPEGLLLEGGWLLAPVQLQIRLTTPQVNPIRRKTALEDSALRVYLLRRNHPRGSTSRKLSIRPRIELTATSHKNFHCTRSPVQPRAVLSTRNPHPILRETLLARAFSLHHNHRIPKHNVSPHSSR